MTSLNALAKKGFRPKFENKTVLSAGEEAAAKKATVEISLTPSADMLVFGMKQISGTTVVKPDAQNGSCIAVPENTDLVLTLELAGPWRWTFGDPVLFPDAEVHDQYFHFDPKQVGKKKAVLHLRSSRLPASTAENRQKFNLCVELTQPTAKVPLTIIIDPDVKNPPPREDP